MKIALVITGLGVGGAERVVCDLADFLSAKGHSVLLIYLHGNALILPKSSNVKVLKVKFSLSPFFLKSLKNTLSEFDPDIVNSHMYHANIACRLVGIFGRHFALISSSHSANEGGWLRSLSYRLTNFLCDEFTNVSNEAVLAFEQKKIVRKGLMTPLHNGVDTSKFVYSSLARNKVRTELRLSDGTYLILSVGSLRGAKDYPNAISAAAMLDKKGVDFLWVIIGEGPERNKIQDLILRNGLSEKIILLGIKHNVSDYMAACDCFVLSSAWEGFGLVVAEAMSCARVVVGTNCGGVSEVIGKHGFCVSPRDSISLASSILSVISLTHKERLEVGRKARIWIEDNFCQEIAHSKWIELYRKNVSS